MPDEDITITGQLQRVRELLYILPWWHPAYPGLLKFLQRFEPVKTRPVILEDLAKSLGKKP